tara:strand:+ start:18863 stop:19093 length:231 start_codon:yes stop_codon:yes gene_type:complete
MKLALYEQIGTILDDCTKREKLDIATWIVLGCLDKTQAGMTEADSYLDVITRHVGDVMTQSRGRLARYGNRGDLNR